MVWRRLVVRATHDTGRGRRGRERPERTVLLALVGRPIQPVMLARGGEEAPRIALERALASFSASVVVLGATIARRTSIVSSSLRPMRRVTSSWTPWRGSKRHWPPFLTIGMGRRPSIVADLKGRAVLGRPKDLGFLRIGLGEAVARRRDPRPGRRSGSTGAPPRRGCGSALDRLRPARRRHRREAGFRRGEGLRLGRCRRPRRLPFGGCSRFLGTYMARAQDGDTDHGGA